MEKHQYQKGDAVIVNSSFLGVRNIKGKIVEAKSTNRLAVQLSRDPRPIWSRSLDGKVYVGAEEVSPA